MSKKILIVGGILIVAALIFAGYRLLFPIDIFVMQDVSMEPTISNGSNVTLNKFDKEFKRQDLIVFTLPGKNLKSVKRIIGIPNDVIEIKNGNVSVNGGILSENYVQGETKKEFNVKLGNDEYYVIGDNRGQSFDSRGYGPIKLSDIIGKVKK